MAATFQGMTAHRQESNCECHWGSAEGLALLKTPDVPLDEDLLRRTYWTTDWRYPGPLLRRILPQLTRSLVAGRVMPMAGMESLGYLFTRARWQEWPKGQRDALRRFLDAWWLHVLVEPDAKVPAHEALELVTETTGKPTPGWLSGRSRWPMRWPGDGWSRPWRSGWTTCWATGSLVELAQRGHVGRRAVAVGDPTCARPTAGARRVERPARSHRPAQPALRRSVGRIALVMTRPMLMARSGESPGDGYVHGADRIWIGW
ncbi:hypothetical protein V2I01_14230 [Micromonospora sp. BRA006-A]|nr:hypothetical protein [Micromonospora sp. BRA006-A]